MKKLFLILFIIPLFLGCESEEKVRSDIDRLKAKRETLRAEVIPMENKVSTAKKEVAELEKRKSNLKNEINVYESGKRPVYLLKLELKQSHVTLDLKKLAKDEMNAITFTLAVDEDVYNSVEKGDNLVDEFRSGSMLMEGSFGSWKMKVVGKEIKTR